MKKTKLMLLILTAMLLLVPTMKADAATKVSYASGTKKATVTLRINNIISIDGEICVKAGKGSSQENIKIVSASVDGGSNYTVSEVQGNKILVVGKGDPVNVSIKVGLEFTKDGAYVIALEGGKTTADGKYIDYREKSDYIETVNVEVGVISTDVSKDEDEEKDTEDDEVDDEKADKEEDNKEEEEKKDTITKSPITSSKTDASIKKETTDLKTAEADKKEVTKQKTDEEKKLEGIISEAEKDLEIDLDSDGKTGEEKVTRSSKSLGSFLKYLKNFWFVFLILFIFLLICMYLLWKLLRKNRKNDYDGAPMVDYRIEDDD